MQLVQLRQNPDRCVYIAFDQDENQAGQNAADALLKCLDQAGLHLRILSLPTGYDPNSYFAAGATPAIFITSSRRHLRYELSSDCKKLLARQRFPLPPARPPRPRGPLGQSVSRCPETS